LDPAEDQSVLESIQGNILKGHGRNYSAGIFVVLSQNEEEARASIHRLTPLVWSASRQQENTSAWKAEMRSGELDAAREREPFCMLGLSAHCYKRLGLDESGPAQAPDSQSTQAAAFQAFQNGMKQVTQTPYAHWDPETATWESHLKHHFDLFIVVANNEQPDLEESIEDIALILRDTAVVRVEIEMGRKSARGSDLAANGAEPIEHFGFADGVAQPVFFKDQAQSLAHRDPSPAQDLDTILWPEKNAVSPESLGSFLSVIKLEQNVRAFRQQAGELKEVLGLPSAEDAQALAVGRQKDGTPLVPAASDDRDDFDYDNDRLIGSGAKQCPASAHIRRMNRRRGKNPLVIARRGFHYGESWMDTKPDDPPKAGVGLLFLGLSSSLHSFISLMGATQGPRCAFQGGVDALVGQSQPSPPGNPSCDGRQRWWHARDRNWVDFRMADFVTLRGGEYFFVPSLHFLRRIKAESEQNGTT
jgi:Dyp-type peroxidase family